MNRGMLSVVFTLFLFSLTGCQHGGLGVEGPESRNEPKASAGFYKKDERPRLVVLPLQPVSVREYDGTGLYVQFLLGNLTALHTGLKEFWLGWRIKKIFPGKGSFERYVRGRGSPPNIAEIGRKEGMRYWVSGRVEKDIDHIRVFLSLTDIRAGATPQETVLTLKLTDHTTGFQKGFLAWLDSCGLTMPEPRKSGIIWPEKTTMAGVQLAGQALEDQYLRASGERKGPIEMALYELAAVATPDSYLAQDLLGWALYKSGNYKRAEEAFQTAVILNPHGIGAISGLMWCAVMMGKEKKAYEWELAKGDLRGDDPSVSRANVANRLGNVAFRAKDYERALSCYKDAVAQNPQKALYKKKVAETFLKMEKFSHALKTIDAALKTHPSKKDQKTLLMVKSRSLSERSVALRKAGEHEESLNVLAQALAIDSHYQPQKAVKDLLEMGDIYEDLNDLENALISYQQANRTMPDQPATLLKLGQLYHRMDDRAKAVSLYREVLKLDPDGPHGKLASAHLRQLTE